MSNAEIAAALSIGEGTVKSHQSEVRCPTSFVVAVKRGIVSL